MSHTCATSSGQSNDPGNANLNLGLPSKSPEEMNIDKLQVQECKRERREEGTWYPSDEKDESDFIQTVRKTVEAGASSSLVCKPNTGTAAPIASTTAAASATSMDAALTSLFSDASTVKNVQVYNPNDTAFHEDYKALLVHRICIPLTMFHPNYHQEGSRVEPTTMVSGEDIILMSIYEFFACLTLGECRADITALPSIQEAVTEYRAMCGSNAVIYLNSHPSLNNTGEAMTSQGKQKSPDSSPWTQRNILVILELWLYAVYGNSCKILGLFVVLTALECLTMGLTFGLPGSGTIGTYELVSGLVMCTMCTDACPPDHHWIVYYWFAVLIIESILLSYTPTSVATSVIWVRSVISVRQAHYMSLFEQESQLSEVTTEIRFRREAVTRDVDDYDTMELRNITRNLNEIAGV
ncbi:hypothetical protein DFS33DRAFT_1272122 [Desarmillaria ectypa]|nr:hypothetical protein DFS33DRAFT_1272122 [Desarmillaria ectypa]